MDVAGGEGRVALFPPGWRGHPTTSSAPETKDVPFRPFQGYPADAQAKVTAALTRKELKFLGGFGLNSHTTLRYRCGTPGVNRLLADLANCPGLSLQVRFAKIDDESDVPVNHSAQSNDFQGKVNLNSGRIRVEDVELPSIKGPDLKR